MNLDPNLGRTDRIIKGVIGAALIAYAFLGPLEKVPVQIFVMGIGLLFIVGGFGGTRPFRKLLSLVRKSG